MQWLEHETLKYSNFQVVVHELSAQDKDVNDY